jgi:hypothetical protein
MLMPASATLAQLAVSANANLVYRKVVEQKKLTKLAEAPIGHCSQGVAFTPDNQYVLVQNMVEKDIMIFKLAGGKLEDTGQRLKVKGGLAAMRMAEKPLERNMQRLCGVDLA